jgi:hypothetical protein
MLVRLFDYLRRHVTGKAFDYARLQRKRRCERTLRLQGISRTNSNRMAALL